MATRTFCDHCGNTVREPNRFTFGPVPVYRDEDEAAKMSKQQYAMVIGQAGVGGASGGGGGGSVSKLIKTVQAQQAAQAAPTKPTVQRVNIDLCDNCVPIWMQRVKKLTEPADEE